MAHSMSEVFSQVINLEIKKEEKERKKTPEIKVRCCVNSWQAVKTDKTLSGKR